MHFFDKTTSFLAATSKKNRKFNLRVQEFFQCGISLYTCLEKYYFCIRKKLKIKDQKVASLWYLLCIVANIRYIKLLKIIRFLIGILLNFSYCYACIWWDTDILIWISVNSLQQQTEMFRKIISRALVGKSTKSYKD